MSFQPTALSLILFVCIISPLAIAGTEVDDQALQHQLSTRRLSALDKAKDFFETTRCQSRLAACQARSEVPPHDRYQALLSGMAYDANPFVTQVRDLVVKAKAINMHDVVEDFAQHLEANTLGASTVKSQARDLAAEITAVYEIQETREVPEVKNLTDLAPTVEGFVISTLTGFSDALSGLQSGVDDFFGSGSKINEIFQVARGLTDLSLAIRRVLPPWRLPRL